MSEQHGNRVDASPSLDLNDGPRVPQVLGGYFFPEGPQRLMLDPFLNRYAVVGPVAMLEKPGFAVEVLPQAFHEILSHVERSFLAAFARDPHGDLACRPSPSPGP